MKIILKNFRCYTDGTYDIPDSGLVSLAGSNGSGKTSLISAIVYALYGLIPGKSKKPFSHGKTTCSVELDYLGLNIVRQARPKRLTVKYMSTEYEDTGAQAIIISVVGMTYDEFMTGAYIMQRNPASVISMSATDQVYFVETLAKMTTEESKAKIKANIKGILSNIQAIEEKIKILQTQLDKRSVNLPATLPEVQNDRDLETTKLDLIILQTELDACQNVMQAATDRIDHLRRDEHTRKDALSASEKLKIEIQLLLDHPAVKEDTTPILKHILSHQETINYYKGYASYLIDRSSTEKAIQEFQEITTKRKEELEQDLLSAEELDILGRRLDEATKLNQEYIEKKALYEAEAKKKEEAKKKLSEEFKRIRGRPALKAIQAKTTGDMLQALAAAKENYVSLLPKKRRVCCPVCASNLFLVGEDNLEVIPVSSTEKEVDESAEVDPQLIKGHIKDIEEHVRVVTELTSKFNVKLSPPGDQPSNPNDIQLRLSSATSAQKEYSRIEKMEYSATLKQMIESVNLMESTYANETTEGETMTLEEVKDYILKLEGSMQEEIKKKDAIDQATLEATQRKKEIATKKVALQKYEKTIAASKNNTSNIKKLEVELSERTRSMADLNAKIIETRDIIDAMEVYERDQRLIEEVKELQNQIVEAENERELLNIRLEGVYGLEDTRKEAEVVVLERTVHSINAHAKIYLDEIFPDGMSIRLECVKGNKLQLNTVIDYKGEAYDSVEEISGGERQGCELAFILAINDILGANILILDESLNEMDTTLNLEVLSSLKSMNNNKRKRAILVVSHEAVRGVFDHEVMLS